MCICCSDTAAAPRQSLAAVQPDRHLCTLPVTRRQYAGRTYSFAVTIVLNFVLFLLIAFGQLAIYSSIRSNTMTGTKRSQQSKDTDIARRLFTIAMSDFLCWFPIGCLGLLASRGVAVSGEASVALAVLVMPVNSAINPFLYTPQPADGETPHQQRGTASQEAGFSGMICILHDIVRTLLGKPEF